MVKSFPVKDAPHQLTLIYKGVFHFKYFYISAWDWLMEEGWRSLEGDNKCETMYAEEHGERGRKVWIWWRTQKDAGNSYYHYFLNVNFIGLGIQDVEVVKDGEKIKAQKGELDIIIKPWIEVDYGGRWANHWLLRHFNEFFQKRIYRNDIIARENEMLRRVYLFHGMLKKTLEMKSFTEDRELYNPKRAI